MRVRVATLNTWALPEPFARDVPERMRHIAQRLDALQADVIAFQEVFTKQARKILVKAGHKAGLNHYHSRAKVGDSGLLTLSRFPILEAHFEAFSLSGNPDHLDNGEYLAGKGFARLRLQTEQGPITVVNTHLHARYTSTHAHQYQAHRIGQVVQMAENLRDCKDPLVALGDFNFAEKHPEYGIFAGLTGLKDSAAQIDTREPTVFRGNAYRLLRTRPDKRIDFAFVREGRQNSLQTVAVNRIFDDPFELNGRMLSASDHAGVLAEYELASGSAFAAPRLDRNSLVLASEMLSQGRAEAERRRVGQRTLAGVGLGCALAAGATVRDPRVSRRKLLRFGLYGAAATALAPAVGLSLVSEVYVPDEIQAFDEAAARLGRMGEPPAIDASDQPSDLQIS